MKKTFILVLMFSMTALASGPQALSVDAFQANELFNYVFVESAERVFTDELIGEDLYKVTYLVEGECAASRLGDACEMVPYCEYIWVEQSKKQNPTMWAPKVDCSQDIEVVLKPQLIDEL